MAVPICAQRGHVRTSAPTGAGSPGCCGALSEGCCRACWEGRRGMPGLAPRLARPRLRPALPRRARVGAGPDSEALMATDSNQNFIHHSHYLFNAAAFVTNRTLMLPSLLFPCTAFRAGAGPWCLRLRRHPSPCLLQRLGGVRDARVTVDCSGPPPGLSPDRGDAGGCCALAVRPIADGKAGRDRSLPATETGSIRSFVVKALWSKPCGLRNQAFSSSS